MKKIKYTFDEVSSMNDEINIMVNDVKTWTFKKEDCTSEGSEVAYDRLLPGGDMGPFYLTDIECNDLNTIKATGAEGHTAQFDEETNTSWKEYAHNKLGSKHFNDTKWLATLDANTPIKVYNQGDTFTDYTKFTSFLINIPRTKFPTGYTLDLSNIDASKITEANYSYYSYYSASNLVSLRYYIAYSFKLPNIKSLYQVFYACTRLIEAPEIPSSVTEMTQTFKDCTSLVSAPKIPSSVTSMVSTFQGCTSLTSIPEIPSSVTCMDSTFNGCTSLTSIPEIPSSVTSMNSTFNGCTSLKNFDVLDIKCKYTPNAFTDCTFENINNLVLTGGYMYAYNIKSCNHVGVVTTNVLIFGGSSNSSNTSSSSYLYYYYYSSNNSCRIFSDYPIKVDAVSTKILSMFSNLRGTPTSTGFNWWVDYIDSDTEAVHQITQRTLNITKHFDTLLKTGEFESDAFDLLIVNPDYVDEEKENHTFELKEFTIISQTPSAYSYGSNATLVIDEEDKSKAKLKLTCTDIVDDSKSKVTVIATVQYKAVIDGYDFLGETKVAVNVAFDFQLVEEVKLKADIVEIEE